MADRVINRTIQLKRPITIGTAEPITSLRVYEPQLGDLMSMNVRPQTLGDSMPIWCALTGEPRVVLEKLGMEDSAAVVAAIAELVGPFVAAMS